MGVEHLRQPRSRIQVFKGHLVVMGVSGCGKSSLAQALSGALGLRLIEGDDYHSPHNIERMQAGIPLTDDDRAGWLQTLGAELSASDPGAVLSCSALKLAYRQLLRQACPGLRFVFLELSPDTALARVKARAPSHFFNPALVRNQFEVLEPPLGETGCLRLDATRPLPELCQSTLQWLQPVGAATPTTGDLP